MRSRSFCDMDGSGTAAAEAEPPAAVVAARPAAADIVSNQSRVSGSSATRACVSKSRESPGAGADPPGARRRDDGCGRRYDCGGGGSGGAGGCGSVHRGGGDVSAEAGCLEVLLVKQEVRFAGLEIGSEVAELRVERGDRTLRGLMELLSDANGFPSIPQLSERRPGGVELRPQVGDAIVDGDPLRVGGRL